MNLPLESMPSLQHTPLQRTLFWRAPLQLSAGRIRIRIWSANAQLTYTQEVYTQEVYAEGDLKRDVRPGGLH
jgi:hypothetical protein